MSSSPDVGAPVLIAAFEGWNDAGSAATDAIRFLVSALDAEEIAAVPPDLHVDYQANRPVASIVDGVVRYIRWPTTRILAGKRAPVLLVLGTEPSFRWRTYCEHVADTALVHGSELVVTLGALLGDSPHRRPTMVTGTAADDETVNRLGLPRSRYEGPTGIVGVLYDVCRTAGVPSASLWAAVPHYASSSPSPKATRALLSRLDSITGIGLDLSRLEVAATAWERQVDAVVAADPDVAEYVRSLEARFDEPEIDPDADPGQLLGDNALLSDGDELPSGDSLAAEFERFLQDGDDD